MSNFIKLHHIDCLELMAGMPNDSVDIILTDPPYLYLKNQKLDRPFDENLFFSEAKRILSKDGFIVMFGRGTSFYRWNTMLSDLDFIFKEEIVWNKQYPSAPCLPLSRVHETVSIHSKTNSGRINKSKVDYLEMKSNDIEKIFQDLKRLLPLLNNEKALLRVQEFLKGEVGSYYEKKIRDSNFNGLTVQNMNLNKPDVNCAMLKQMMDGMREKSIISIPHDRYSRIHPTQKPVRLLERLLEIVIPKNKKIETVSVFDPFGGSFSTMEAVHNIGCKGISCEIDSEYFNIGSKRINDIINKKIKEEPLFK